MADTPLPPADGSPPPDPAFPNRRYWIDEDGNVHGVVMSMEVDHYIEFNDVAVVFPRPDPAGG